MTEAYGQRNTVCRECGKNVAGQPQVQLGNTAKGRTRVCIECVVKHQLSSGVPSRLDKFVEWYLETIVKADPRDRKIAALEERLAQIEAQQRENRG